jgi:hypothetical protein
MIMRGEDRDWMAYIDAEVRAVCQAKGWGHQIRRKSSIREKPVALSPVEDYEWKLIPGAQGKLPDAPLDDFDGTYYLFSFDKPNEKFIFQHDTTHCGVWGLTGRLPRIRRFARIASRIFGSLEQRAPIHRSVGSTTISKG